MTLRSLALTVRFENAAFTEPEKTDGQELFITFEIPSKSKCPAKQLHTESEMHVNYLGWQIHIRESSVPRRHCKATGLEEIIWVEKSAQSESRHARVYRSGRNKGGSHVCA